GDGVVVAVVLARPLVVHWLACGVDAVHRDLDHVPRGLIDNGRVLRPPGGELRPALVQLPRAHIQVRGETRRGARKKDRQTREDRSRFHVPSFFLWGHSIFTAGPWRRRGKRAKWNSWLRSAYCLPGSVRRNAHD